VGAGRCGHSSDCSDLCQVRSDGRIEPATIAARVGRIRKGAYARPTYWGRGWRAGFCRGRPDTVPRFCTFSGAVVIVDMGDNNRTVVRLVCTIFSVRNRDTMGSTNVAGLYPKAMAHCSMA
jgi:hypothetical protein